MERATSSQEFRAAPVGRYVSGNGWLLWRTDPELCGSILWGRVDEAAIREIATPFASLYSPQMAPRCAVLADASRMEGIDGDAFRRFAYSPADSIICDRHAYVRSLRRDRRRAHFAWSRLVRRRPSARFARLRSGVSCDRAVAPRVTPVVPRHTRPASLRAGDDAMMRPITGFRTDAEGDWVAVLSCGHPQHVRHRPPFTLRPWVTTEEGRRDRIGMPLNCVRCDAFELPAGFVAYKRTRVFTETTIPDMLRRDHATRPGVWAQIIVLEGRLRYTVDTPPLTTELSADRPGIVPSEARHRVEPLGPVRFQVEFWAAPSVSGG